MKGAAVCRGMQCALAVFSAAMLSGCGAGLESLPLPAPVASGQSYAVTAVFSNALNLPEKAKVKFNGADIGEVESIRTRDFAAQVKMRIRADVPLQAGSTAELRSATLLSDVFVQIKPDPSESGATAMLRDGDTIPLKSTAAAPTVEEVLNSMALLVNGGTIGNLVKTINGAGRAVGGRGQQVSTLLNETKTLLSRMNARSGQLDTALRRTSDLAAVMSARRKTLDDVLSVGAPAMSTIADNSTRLADMTDSVARITRQLSRFPSIQGTDTRSLTADLNRLSEVFNEISIDPDLTLTPYNRLAGIIMKATNGTVGHIDATFAKLSLAPWPDKNYPGDPGFHWSDGTDWHQMVGSLRYEWNLFLNKVYGDQRWNPAAPR